MIHPSHPFTYFDGKSLFKQLWRAVQLQSGFHLIPLPNPPSQVGGDSSSPGSGNATPSSAHSGEWMGTGKGCTPGVAGMGRGTGRAGFGRSPAQLGLCLARRKLWIFSINIPRQTPDGSRTFPLAGETVEKTKDPDWNRLSQDTPSSGDTAGRSQPQLRGQPANKEGLWPLPLRTSSDVPWDGHCELLSLELQGVSRVCRT